MAEILLSAFLTAIFEKLGTAAFKKLPYFKEIHPELTKWETSLSQIRALLNDASHKEQTNESVKLWLNRLQHLAYDIDDVLDALVTEAMQHELTEEPRTITNKVRKLIPACCTSFPLTTRMHRKLDDINARLQDLEKETHRIGLIVKNEKPKKITNKKNETCLPVDESGIVGRQSEKKTLLHKLVGDDSCKEKFGIVPIVGMGGVGKTTLARLLYNDRKVNDHFQLKAWVCVSDEFDIFFISQVLYQSVTGENKEFKDLNLLQVALNEKLKEKRFLIVLDDVWSESYGDWETLVRPFHSGAVGSKVIITTRKDTLLKKLGYDHLDSVESLSSVDALSVLAQHALGVDNFDSHPTLEQYGVKIVTKCGGLPLALKVLGRLLRKNTDDEHWEGVLKSDLWESKYGDEIVPALRLSYHDLPTRLKHLFAYCSLFPKDYLFDKEELVLLWMAEGFLPQSTSNNSMECWGSEYFDELLSRSFFQHAPNEESLYVMHDLMSDLATSVVRDIFSRQDIGMNKELMKDALEKYRHVSFVCEPFMIYEKFKEFNRAKCLRTFLAFSPNGKESWRTFYLSNMILADLLHKLPLLRVLSLNHLSITKVPESIGGLKHLRYLNLHGTNITHIPESVCRLYNLQTLIVARCRYLTNLPKSFLMLKNLRHFDIRDTQLLNKIPIGIGELKNLRILASTIIIEGDHVFGVTGLKELMHLQEKSISVEGLENVRNPVHAQEANLSEKRFSELRLSWNNVFDGSRMEFLEKEVLNMLRPRVDSLKTLAIVYYGGRDFPNWVGDPSFLHLAYVFIDGCKNCTYLPQLGRLPSLKNLHIENMYGVIGWKERSTERGVFPRLELLCIKDCPNLIEISVEALPTLRLLKVAGCSDYVFTSLVHVASSSVKNLKIYDISGLTDEVWRGVIEHLGAVEKVSIYRCNEIRYLWESDSKASKALVNLRMLEVYWCSNLLRLGEKEDNSGSVTGRESNLLTSLRILKVRDCSSMEHCSCPNGIKDLAIIDCDSITSVSFPTGGGGGQKLKSLWISNCKKLVSENNLGGEEKAILLINNTSMSMLEFLSITGLVNLESLVELRRFVHLTRLTIVNCPNMKSFPDDELQNLSMLKEIVIINCPGTDASFPRGLWPPKLLTLEIGGLKKPISEWGQQNFPTSLVHLILYGEKECVRSWSELSHLLPPSLITLGLRDFKYLKSLSMGLQHLTSLQHLEMENCPNMKYLPETKTMLFSSLLRLRIHECPILRERCNGRGSYYWPLISHIPYIDIR